ncbi:7243_t:CDS:2 [Funneliformis geosporum]|uniref:7243_t:CDS:1 n=1 Tax=Funneliformis geosporum TaxID=1117311 RepID=A0A9W4WLT2_9GLOM|nr:7243_t:CDS:2 [Funneliformis geosporum]
MVFKETNDSSYLNGDKLRKEALKQQFDLSFLTVFGKHYLISVGLYRFILPILRNKFRENGNIVEIVQYHRDILPYKGTTTPSVLDNDMENYVPKPADDLHSFVCTMYFLRNPLKQPDLVYRLSKIIGIVNYGKDVKCSRQQLG